MDAVQSVAAEALEVLGTGRQVAPFSRRHPGFGLEEAYRAAALVRAGREARGERPVGRKIGFTNRRMWAEYDVHAPIWGPVYDGTVSDLTDETPVSLADLAEPRIEPEIVFGLGAAPAPGMELAELLGCVAWVAHGFEVVQSIFPGWRFAPADTVAAYGLHGRLLIGSRHPVAPRAEAWARELPAFAVELLRDGEVVDRGRSDTVLDGPVHALRHLVGLLAADPAGPPLAAGEIVTTGTLTRALPVAPGERWATRLDGIALPPASLRFG